MGVSSCFLGSRAVGLPRTRAGLQAGGWRPPSRLPGRAPAFWARSQPRCPFPGSPVFQPGWPASWDQAATRSDLPADLCVWTDAWRGLWGAFLLPWITCGALVARARRAQLPPLAPPHLLTMARCQPQCPPTAGSPLDSEVASGSSPLPTALGLWRDGWSRGDCTPQGAGCGVSQRAAGKDRRRAPRLPEFLAARGRQGSGPGEARVVLLRRDSKCHHVQV